MIDREYARECLLSLKVGTPVFPATNDPKSGTHPAVVEQIDVANGRAILRSATRAARLVLERPLAARWNWLGKPEPKPKPMVLLPTIGSGTKRPDNISPMWAAIRRLEGDVAHIKSELGLKPAI